MVSLEDRRTSLLIALGESRVVSCLALPTPVSKFPPETKTPRSLNPTAITQAIYLFTLDKLAWGVNLDHSYYSYLIEVSLLTIVSNSEMF